MDRTNNHLHLLERIKKLNVYTIERMSPETMRRVTDGFDESLVRNVIYAGKTNDEQRKIINAVKKKYNEWNKSNNFLWLEEYPEFIEDLQMDIECGLVVTVDNSFPDLEFMPKQKAEKKNNDITDEKDKLISELKQEVTQIKNKFEQYKKKNTEEGVSSKATAEENVNTLKEKVHTLEEEIADLETREGIDAPKAALLVRIVLSNYGGLPNNRENAWPIITNLWGVKESNAKKRLREGVKEETVEALASLFKDVSPKIERFIREEGGKIIVQQKK